MVAERLRMHLLARESSSSTIVAVTALPRPSDAQLVVVLNEMKVNRYHQLTKAPAGLRCRVHKAAGTATRSIAEALPSYAYCACAVEVVLELVELYRTRSGALTPVSIPQRTTARGERQPLRLEAYSV